MNCGNCGAQLSCGCQKRVAANGKQCCNACISKCNQDAGGGSQPKPPRVYPPSPYTPHK